MLRRVAPHRVCVRPERKRRSCCHLLLGRSSPAVASQARQRESFFSFAKSKSTIVKQIKSAMLHQKASEQYQAAKMQALQQAQKVVIVDASSCTKEEAEEEQRLMVRLPAGACAT